MKTTDLTWSKALNTFRIRPEGDTKKKGFEISKVYNMNMWKTHGMIHVMLWEYTIYEDIYCMTIKEAIDIASTHMNGVPIILDDISKTKIERQKRDLKNYYKEKEMRLRHFNYNLNQI